MAPKKSARNPELIPGIRKISRSAMYHKRGLWAIKEKHGGKFPVHEKAAAALPVVEKPPKFYPADDIKKPLSNKRKLRPTKLRASITPGAVLIILAGRFQGKRVVFLKQLTSGLLLVTVSLQDQWRSSKACQSGLCHWDIGKSRCFWAKFG
ncbi:60S ribosomal protein L6 [Orobanche hederae]